MIVEDSTSLTANSTLHNHVSRVKIKPTIWTRSNTNQAAQAQKMARYWKF